MDKTKVELQPVVISKSYADAVEDLIKSYFKQFIYMPLMLELRALKVPSSMLKLSNSTDRDKLIDDLMKGTIYYHRGIFKGKFSAETVKEMRRLKAIYDGDVDGWRVPQERIPTPIRTAIVNSQVAFDNVILRLQKKLDSVTYEKFAGSIPLDKIFEKIIYKVDDQVQATFLGIPGTKKKDGKIVIDETFKPNAKKRKIPKGATTEFVPDEAPTIASQTKQKVLSEITISPKFDEVQAAKIAKEYSNTTKLAIQKFTKKETQDLRSKIMENVMNGERYESIVKTIEESYGVTQRKAQFLARQETNLLTVKIKETRYQKAGITEYKWKCVAGSPNHPVRPLHKIHDNKVFRFDNPPIVDKIGNRKNPGEDYNCRCTAIPVVRFDED